MSRNLTYYVAYKSAIGKEFLAISSFANSNGLSMQIKEFGESNQMDFMLNIHRDLAVIIDATIPKDLKGPTVYPILTAQVNILNHIIVFSREIDEEGNEILPLNISPQRKRTKKMWIYHYG